VGDGNFHIIFPVDPTSASDLAEAERLSDRIVERTLSMGGTCSGEHGVGLGKKKFLAREHGDGLDVMRTIKAALDPHAIMNPGKLVDP
jgi:D-lactate dehydrogenase (cytochrome)